VRSPFYLCTYVGKEYQKDFARYPKGCRLFAISCRDRKVRDRLRYLALGKFERSLVDEFGWSELKFVAEWRAVSELLEGSCEYVGGSTAREFAEKLAEEKRLDNE